MKGDMITMDESILLQYIDGVLSAEKCAEVELWASLSPENEKLLRQLYYTSQVVDRLQIIKKIDTDEALKSFKSTVYKQSRKVSLRKVVKVWQVVAAVILIPVVALSLWGLLSDKKEKVQMMEVHSNPGIVSVVNLPDGSKVWLNAESSLSYPSAFTSENRTVELKGEGYFEVLENKKKPFIVKIAPSYTVEVLGTSFNISAYESDDVIETTLVEGVVKLHLGQGGVNRKSSQLLNPNEKATINRLNGNLTIDVLDVSNETAWLQGELVFRNEPMSEVIKVLGRHFNVDFQIRDKEVLTSVITARFTDEQLPQVMEFLKFASDIDYEIKPRSATSKKEAKRTVVEIRKSK